jgi:predicted GIY-YIG superfamily endonuclease
MKYVYILKSINSIEKYYVGITENLNERLKEHNSNKCTHTKKYAPWEINVAIHFTDDNKAIKFEKYLKSGSGRAFAIRHF